MGLEGRLFEEEDMVMFGKPIPEKALEALKNRSPTADSIIKSLPQSAFIPIAKPKVIEPEEKESTQKKSNKKSRLERKKLRKQQERTNLEKLIESEIKKENKMDLEKELEMLEKEISPKKEKIIVSEEPVKEEAPQMKDQILQLLEGE